MQRYVLALFVICVLGIWAILLLRPEPAVKFEAELSYMEPDEALQQLDSAIEKGSFGKNLHLMHARLSMAAGDLISARTSYEQVLTDGTDNPQVLDELADLAALEGDIAEAASFKAIAQDLAPEPRRRLELGYWYRLVGDRQRETELLEAVSPRRLEAFERRRLVELYFEDGNIPSYQALLTVMSGSNGEERLLARRQFIELNIEIGQPEKALALALEWNVADPEDRESLATCLRAFVGRGATAEAIQLAEHAIVANPDIGPVPVEIFVSSGHGGVGRQMQVRWLDNDAKLDDADWQALALIAERTGDLSALWRALARKPDGSVPPPPEVFLQFLRYQGPRALLPYGSLMTETMFERMPLLGAAWYSWHRQAPATYKYLVVATESPLTDWDRAIWMSIAQDLRGTPFYRELMAGASKDDGIRDLLRDSIVAPVPTTSLPAESATTAD